ncbi:MAG: hypothetical protein IJE84_05120, partial [Clostridia bacterium]|nr:hypothetical protein [Clostridia bacterium]
IFNIFLALCLVLSCFVGCSHQGDVSDTNDTSVSGVADTAADTVLEWVEDFSEQLPSHLHKINGSYYLDVQSDTQESVESGSASNGFHTVDELWVEFSSFAEAKSAILNNSFTDEQKIILSKLAAREEASGIPNKLKTVKVSNTDKINALSLIDEVFVLYAGGIRMKGILKDNKYECVEYDALLVKGTYVDICLYPDIAYYNSRHEYLHRSVTRHEYEEVEIDGIKAKKVVVASYSTIYVYDISDGNTEIVIRSTYVDRENPFVASGAFSPVSYEAPNRVDILVKNEEEGICYEVQLYQFKSDPPLDWILQFAKIND